MWIWNGYGAHTNRTSAEIGTEKEQKTNKHEDQYGNSESKHTILVALDLILDNGVAAIEIEANTRAVITRIGFPTFLE